MYQMKLIFSAFLILMTGCASFLNKEEPSTTVTDMSNISRTNYYFNLAQNYLSTEDYDKSIDYFKLALLHDGQNLEARLGLAKAYQSTNQTQLAFEELNEISLDKINEVHFRMVFDFYVKAKSFEKAYEWSQTYYSRSQRTSALWSMYEAALLMKNYDRAHKTLDLLKSSDQPQLLVYLAQAATYEKQKDYDKALMSLKLAEDISPLDEMVLKKMVQLYSFKKDWESVVKFGEKYIQYQKRTLLISELVARASTLNKSYDKAIANYKWLSENADESFESIYTLKLAHVYFLNQNYSEAKSIYIDVLSSDKGNNEAKYYLGLTHEALKEEAASERVLELVDKTSIYYPDAQVRLATKEYKENSFKDALERVQKASQERPESSVLYKAYADYLIESKDFPKALQVINKADVNVGLDADLYITKAYCQFKMNNQKAFASDLDKTLKLDPSNVKTYEYLSLLWYQDRKKLSETEYLSKVALELGSTNQHIQKILIWTYIDLNKPELASRMLEEQYDKNPQDVFYAEMLARVYRLQSIHSRAQEFSKYAEKLKAKNEIRFPAEEKILNDSLVNDFQRLPASFDL